MKNRLRYGLKTIFCATTIAAVVAGSFFWWRWWHYTRHMRELSNAVTASAALDGDTKFIIQQLAWSSNAWDSGLIRELAGPTSIKQVVWMGRTNSGCKIYIFDAFIRPAADTPFPPICVVFDKQGNSMVWEPVAPYSSGFLRASIDDHDILTITTRSNFFLGKGIYKYTIKCNSIMAMDDGHFVKFGKEDHAENVPQLMSSDPVLDGVVKQIKARLN